MITLQSLWSHFGYMKVRFQKPLVFPTNFNYFIKVLGEFGVDLGLLWDHFWHMGVTLGPLWVHFGGSWPKLAPSWTKAAASWSKLAQLGGLGPFEFEKVLPA